jgi:prepilin-type N-terminal cleavage/methylation domain-containing protein
MRTRSDDGFSLIELLVTMGVSLAILTAVLALWSGASANEQRNAERFDSVDAARNGLERMTRDVREATAVTGISDRLVTLKLWTRDLAGATPSVLHTITYNCGAGGSVASTYRCLRTDTSAGSPAVTVVDQLTSPSVFTTVAGQPNLQIRLSVLVADATFPVVMHSGASPRNCIGALSGCT